jgi:tRNA modification GTPase
MENEIIAAIATPPGRGSIGVVRISGAGLSAWPQTLSGRAVLARRAELVDFKDATGAPIDRGLLLFFPAPHSYTGEDVIELQGHGGSAVMKLLLSRCLELGARPAEPGEFTKRAFLNGKIDLAQAESVADLIDATTGEAARAAVRSLQGQFSDQVGAAVASLKALRSRIEALLDFPEEDVAPEPGFQQTLAALQYRLEALLANSHQGNLLREGVHVTLAGHPNVGKSSLLNQFARENIAIVTETPGTTRDAIRHPVEMQGIPIYFTDTAGLRPPEGEVETIGISIAWKEIASADIVLWIADVTRPDTAVLAPMLAEKLSAGTKLIRVANKIDCKEPAVTAADDLPTINVSAKTGAGLELLREAILEAAGWKREEGTYLARARHVAALKRAADHVAKSYSCAELELKAEELRLAQQTLTKITGEFTADDLLGEIFSTFCIGK